MIDIKYNEVVNLDGCCLDIIKNKGNALKVQVDTSKEDIEQVLTNLIKCGKVNDITISEPPLEEIIAHIYQQSKDGDRYEIFP